MMEKCAGSNIVVLGSNYDLFSKNLLAHEMNWIAWDVPPMTFRAKTRIRYNHTEQWVRVTVKTPNSLHIEFDEPQRAIAIAKGQAVVVYQDD